MACLPIILSWVSQKGYSQPRKVSHKEVRDPRISLSSSWPHKGGIILKANELLRYSNKNFKIS